MNIAETPSPFFSILQNLILTMARHLPMYPADAVSSVSLEAFLTALGTSKMKIKQLRETVQKYIQNS